MAALAAAVVGGSLLSAGATIGSSIGAAEIQSKNSNDLQQKSQDFQKSVIDRGEKAFTDANLPKFLYYNPDLASKLPNTLTHLGGTSYAQSFGVNSNLPYYSSNNPAGQYLGTAKPRPSTASVGNSGSSSRPLPRPGIGFVRASDSPTPNNESTASPIRVGGNDMTIGSPEYQRSLNLMYNSRGTQYGPQTRTFGSQTGYSTRTSFSQTRVSLGSGPSSIS